MIRRKNEKTENHKKQRLATLKRLKRGDDNELERNLRLEKVVTSIVVHNVDLYNQVFP